MIKFNQYSKSSTIGSENLSFRKYMSEENTKFAKYVNGTLTRIEPEDFGDMTTLSDYCITGSKSLERIEMSDNIVSASLLSISLLPNLKEIVFSANFSSFEDGFLSTIPLLNLSSDVTLDFSKAKQVPTSSGEAYSSSYFHAKITTIKVPVDLYDQWIKAYPFKIHVSIIVAV